MDDFSLSEEEIMEAMSKIHHKYLIESEEDYLLIPRNDLKQLLQYNDSQLVLLLQHFSFPLTEHVLRTRAKNALEMEKEEKYSRKLSYGCPLLDSAMEGIQTNGITELAGPPGSGKTQLCFQLALQAQLPLEMGGLDGRVLYFSTEGSVPIKRLQQIAESFKKKWHPKLENHNFLDHIIIHDKISSPDYIVKLLENQIPELIKNNQIRLIIVDSIAGLFRFDTEQLSYGDRSNLLWQQANSFRLFSSTWNFPIVITNQVSDYISHSEFSSGPKIIPTLGLSWSNCINTRIMVERMDRTHSNSISNVLKKFKGEQATSFAEPSATNRVLRRLQVVFAPDLENTECYFEIDEKGIRGLKSY